MRRRTAKKRRAVSERKNHVEGLLHLPCFLSFSFFLPSLRLPCDKSTTTYYTHTRIHTHTHAHTHTHTTRTHAEQQTPLHHTIVLTPFVPRPLPSSSTTDAQPRRKRPDPQQAAVSALFMLEALALPNRSSSAPATATLLTQH